MVVVEIESDWAQILLYPILLMEPVSLSELWLPILLGGLAVFFASFVMRMVLKHHWSDYEKLPDEDAVREAFQKIGVEGGRQYSIPHCSDAKSMQDPEWMAKWAEGPTGMMFLFPKGPYQFGSALGKSFAFNVAVAFVVAYLASNFLVRGAESMDVLQFTGTIGFLTFGGAYVWGPIWMAQSWKVLIKDLVDSLVYGLSLGGVFVAFWPGA